MRSLKIRLSAWASAGALTLGVAQRAEAAKYEVFVEIETEDDIYDLYLDDQIGEETLNTLIGLYQRRVDLNTASRERLYALPNLTYEDVDAILDHRDRAIRIREPHELVEHGILSEKTLRSIQPFLSTSDEDPFETEGRVRWMVRGSNGDSGWPASALQARITTLRHLTVGAAAVGTRSRLHDVRYDPARDALSAEAPQPRLVVPKAYAFWDSSDYSVIVGTYRAGFGERLTFDTSSQYTPHGLYLDDEVQRVNALGRVCRESAGELDTSPCTGEAGRRYEMPDFSWSNQLRGVAAGIKDLPLNPGAISAYAFVSHQPHDVYQYQIYDRRNCFDPHDDDPGCSAPPVFRRRADPYEPTSRWSFHTLPGLFTETLAGGNVTYRIHRRSHVGVTGYRSTVTWNVDEMELDFQNWARLPYGGPFGAVGLDGSWGRGWFDVFFEAARSFDSTPGGGGGSAGLVRGTATWKRNELEASVRYYETAFANPHARPISAASLHDGLRARDELGARVRYTGRLAPRLQVRSNVDAWRALSTKRISLDAYVRGDYKWSSRWQTGVWGQVTDRDVQTNGGSQCFQSPFETDEEGEPLLCTGSRYRGAGRVRFAPSPRFFVSAQVRHDWLDDGRYVDRMRRDVAGWLTLGARPFEALSFRARLRYLFEDVTDNEYLEQSLWAYADVRYRFLEGSWIQARYDVLHRLDERESTRTRRPAPEQWVALEVEVRF